MRSIREAWYLSLAALAVRISDYLFDKQVTCVCGEYSDVLEVRSCCNCSGMACPMCWSDLGRGVSCARCVATAEPEPMPARVPVSAAT